MVETWENYEVCNCQRNPNSCSLKAPSTCYVLLYVSSISSKHVDTIFAVGFPSWLPDWCSSHHRNAYCTCSVQANVGPKSFAFDPFFCGPWMAEASGQGAISMCGGGPWPNFSHSDGLTQFEPQNQDSARVRLIRFGSRFLTDSLTSDSFFCNPHIKI